MSTAATALKAIPQPKRGRIPIDVPMLLGIAIALAATVGGIAASGVRLTYFLQPTGLCIVLGGTVGVIFITTPRINLTLTARRFLDLFRLAETNREALLEEIVSFAKLTRSRGVVAIEPAIQRVQNGFLKESLMLCLDETDKNQLRAALEIKIRLRERQGETDAKVLEVAGGFAPTIGVIGTVVGLIEVLRNFSDLSSVAGGIGAAFVSTIYGLGLANLILLPAAHRIRARVAETFEIHEMITEGVVCVSEGLHPSLVRDRLSSFLRGKNEA